MHITICIHHRFYEEQIKNVDRAYEKQGIGSELMKRAHQLAGGEKDIAIYLIANENAIPFYEKLGMNKSDEVMQYNKVEWTDFTVE